MRPYAYALCNGSNMFICRNTDAPFCQRVDHQDLGSRMPRHGQHNAGSMLLTASMDSTEGLWLGLGNADTSYAPASSAETTSCLSSAPCPPPPPTHTLLQAAYDSQPAIQT
jgi:hypothetical protein